MENSMSRASSANRITNVLDNTLIESILTRLPIRDAARTSVLSSLWRHRWRDMPHLVFDEAFWESMAHLPPYIVLNRIYEIIAAHGRPILKFSLDISALTSLPQINQVICHVVENGVQELTVRIGGYHYHPLPWQLYEYQQLTHLNLRWCHLEPPPTFRRFPRLICLVLCEVRFASGVLARLISCSPQLEELMIERSHVDCLEMVAPNLKSFCFKGVLQPVGVINAPRLATVSIDVGFPPFSRYSTQGATVDSVGFLLSLAVVENLHLDYLYVRRLAARNLDTVFIRLQVLKLSNISFEHNEVLGILNLTGNCPNLRKVTIDVYSRGEPRRLPFQRLYEGLGRTDFSFNRMKEMRIVCLTGSEMEMLFIKFVLARSPELEKMIMVLKSVSRPTPASRILFALSQFPRSSGSVDIILQDPSGLWF